MPPVLHHAQVTTFFFFFCHLLTFFYENWPLGCPQGGCPGPPHPSLYATGYNYVYNVDSLPRSRHRVLAIILIQYVTKTTCNKRQGSQCLAQHCGSCMACSVLS